MLFVIDRKGTEWPSKWDESGMAASLVAISPCVSVLRHDFIVYTPDLQKQALKSLLHGITDKKGKNILRLNAAEVILL